MFRLVKLGCFFCALVLSTASGGGCFRDPNVRKQKFFEQGNRDFEQGKYSEALIFYGRALQIDPCFAEAHYKMARCHVKQGSWAPAYQKVQRAIDLQPENWPAQLDLGQHADAQMLLANSDTVLGNLKAAIGKPIGYWRWLCDLPRRSQNAILATLACTSFRVKHYCRMNSWMK